MDASESFLKGTSVPLFEFFPLFRGDTRSFGAFEEMGDQVRPALEIWLHVVSEPGVPDVACLRKSLGLIHSIGLVC